MTIQRDAVGKVYLLAIRHHSTFEIGSAVGHFGNTVDQVPAGTVFHRCQGQATLREEFANRLLWGVVIVPPDIRGQPGHNGLFDWFDHGLRRGDIAGPGNHAEMDAIGFRIDAQVGVLPPEEFGNTFIHSRLRQPHGFDIPSDRDVASGKLAQARLHLLFPHRVHLRWRARHGDNNFAVPLDPPPGRSTRTIRQKLRRRNQMGLLDIGGWHASAALLKIALKLFKGLLLDRRGLLQRRGNSLTGQVVLGWSQAARGQDEVSALQGAGEPCGEHGQTVTDDGDPLQLDAQRWQPRRQPGGIRIRELTHEQFRTNREDFGFHEHSPLRVTPLKSEHNVGPLNIGSAKGLARPGGITDTPQPVNEGIPHRGRREFPARVRQRSARA